MFDSNLLPSFNRGAKIKTITIITIDNIKNMKIKTDNHNTF